MNDYYVYEHIRLDNNQCFYVGKGHGKRCDYKSRNEHHDRIVEKYGMKVKIIAENLSESEAYEIEQQVIAYYVFVLGFGIDIIGYNNNPNENGHLTNHTFGGDGSKGMVHSEEWCAQHSADMYGENNPAYGKNYWETFSEEKINNIKEKLSKASSGSNNPMYGISPAERMDEQTYAEWKRKTQARLSSQTGENNPNYGNKTLHNKVKDRSDLRIQYYSRPGSQNGRARGIVIKDKNGNLLSEFETIGDGCVWLKETYGFKTSINGMRSNMSKAIRNNRPYKNFTITFK